MPCYDTETHDRPIRLEAKIHYLTKLLCSLCTSVQRNNPDYLPNLPEVYYWWLKHQAFDQIGDALIQKVEEQGIDSLNQEEENHYWKRKFTDAENP